MNPVAADALARTRAWVATQPGIAASLAAIPDPAEFGRALQASLIAQGRSGDATALATLAFEAPAPAGTTIEVWPLPQRLGWQALALEWGAAGAELVWCCGEVSDTAPFHENIVAQLRYRPFNRWFAQRTPLTPEFVAGLEAEALPLAGMILHESRCGSTVISQALKAWRGTRVVSEPGLLDVALTAVLSGMDPAALTFRGALAALRQPARDDARVVVKLDAWHALAIGALRTLMPDVPWLFAYRKPLEVLVSHALAPGRHTVPGMLPEAWLATAPTDAMRLPIEHAGRVLGSICAAVVPHAQADRLFNYAEIADPGSDALSTRIPRLFGLDPADLDAERYASTLGRHAKRPGEAFTDDRAAKAEAATAALREIAGRWMEPHYAALERIRLRR